MQAAHTPPHQTQPNRPEPSQRALVAYLLVSFGLAWVIELGPVRALGLTSAKPVVTLLMVAVMFTPAIGAVVARLIDGRGFNDAGLRWGRGRYHLVAWLLPFAIGVAATGLTIALGVGELDLTGKPVLDKLPEVQRAAAAQQVEQFGGWWPLVVILGALIQGVPITSIATFGEEFGWRGYLQPRLAHLGGLRSMIVVGVIWGIWHAPVIAQGHNYPDHPFWGVPLMTAFCAVWGVLLGWLFEKSGSIIAPTLAHASLNSGASSLMAFVGGADNAVGNVTGVIGLAVAAVVVLWLFTTGRLTESAPLSESTSPP